MNLTKNFTLEELVFSQESKRKNIDNTPNYDQISCLRSLCINTLQPIRDELGIVIVTSGYRSPEVNQAIGGVENSQHCLGQAGDIIVPNLSVYSLFNFIKGSNIEYDQLIIEFNSWVHVSFCEGKNRKQAFGIESYLSNKGGEK